MGGEDDEPTADQVQEIRERIDTYVAENGKSSFDPRDLESLMSNDFLVKRYFMHVYDIAGDQVENAVNMIINSFRWRKEVEIRDINEQSLNPNLMEKGVLLVHNRDRDGKKLLIFDVKKHVKGKEKMDDMKRFFLYFIERIEREENGDKLTLVYDCAGCGIRNMDMEFIQFTISVFKDYTPYNLHYILVYDMPWVLNAAWKIIKTWLPAGAVKKIKFLNKTNIDEYVTADQRLLAWGGDDDWEYQFEPERHVVATSPLPTNNHSAFEDSFSSNVSLQKFGSAVEFNPEGSVDELRKKVHFANNNKLGLASPTPSVDIPKGMQSPEGGPLTPVSRSAPQSSSAPENIMDLLSLSPSEEVVFTQSLQGDLLAKVKVKNIAEKPVAFKIKTTSPDKYRVRPSMCNLSPGSTALIEIHVQAAQIGSTSSLVRDKFLITAVIVDKEGMNHQEMADVMKSAKPEAQYRLRCILAASANNIQSRGAPPASKPGATSLDTDKQVETMSKRVSSLVQSMTELRDEVAFLRTLLYVLLVLAVALIIVVFWRSAAQTCPDLMAQLSMNTQATPETILEDVMLPQSQEL